MVCLLLLCDVMSGVVQLTFYQQKAEENREGWVDLHLALSPQPDSQGGVQTNVLVRHFKGRDADVIGSNCFWCLTAACPRKTKEQVTMMLTTNSFFLLKKYFYVRKNDHGNSSGRHIT